jgi:hypothetical protein
MNPPPLVRIRDVLLPREHGGWSMALEPVVLGLLVAPSWPGAALAGAVLAAFLARRPLQLVAGAGRPVNDPRRRPAMGALGLCGLIAIGFALVAAGFGDPRAYRLLAFALPPGALFCWLDLQGDARTASAEFAGTIAFALLPAGFVVGAGGRTGPGLALAAAMAARSLPAVLTIRTFLRGRKGQPVSLRGPVFAAGLAIGGTAMLAAKHLAPWTATGFAIGFALRTLWLLGPRPPALRATHLGILEAGLGTAYVLAVGLTWPAA